MAKAKQSASTKNALIKQASTQTFIAVAVASVVVSMCLVMLNILWGNLKYNSRVHGAQENARDTLQANLDITDELEASFRNLEIGGDLISSQGDDKDNSEIILDALPSKFDFPELASAMENLADKSSVELDSIRGTDLGSDATSSSQNPSPEQIPFGVDVVGSYTNVNKFLKGLENSIRPMKVVSVSLTGTTQKMRASIRAETSYQPAFDLNIRTEVVQ